MPPRRTSGHAVGWCRCASSEAGAAGAGWPPSSPTVGAADLGPGARVHLRHLGLAGRRRGPATCVDLFCGSGALGVEALSRGAASATFVDLESRRARRRAHEPRRGRAGRRAGHAGAGVAARAGSHVRAGAGVRPRAVRPALRLRGLAGAARARCGPTVVVMESARTDRAPRGLGGHERAPVRRYARHRGSSQR